MRTVFLAMHRAVKAMWIVLPSVVTPSRSPNKQTKGEAGIEHLRHFETTFLTVCIKPASRQNNRERDETELLLLRFNDV